MTNYKLPEELSKLIEEKSAAYKPTLMQSNVEQLKAITILVENKKIKPIVDLVYSLEDGDDAYEYLAQGKAKEKVIISLSFTFKKNVLIAVV